MRLLIAEDDPVSRRLLQAMLARWEYDVVVACDGAQAWAVLQEEDPPRLAILDWMMPGMDGLQICREARRLTTGPYTYIILLTAKSRTEDVVEGITAGADDYVTKPVDSQELRARIRAGRRILDLLDELVSMRQALQEQATHDALTGLPNRLLFSDRLTRSMAEARRHKQMLAVMFLDLDGFKLVNDTLGHDGGDLLLRKVAERLTGCLREVDTVARMGGDEFTIILEDIKQAQDAAKVARKVLDALSKAFVLRGRELTVTASMGISLYPADGNDVETLVRQADNAMYRAKEQGRNTYHLYSDALSVAAVEQMTLVNGLRNALDRDEFVLHYQPRVDIRTGEILGAEALVRWRHPDLGLVPPSQFIGLAEETGLIVPMSEWVMRTACAQNKEWQDAGLPPIGIAVNISTRQFQHKGLRKTVEKVLRETGLDSNYLDLELTESTLMQNPDLALQLLCKLKAMGVRVSIDDFGTGYSSLSYLKRFPIDAVKIDQSFVRDITSNPDDAAIAGAIVAMAHSLKLKVIAEGVETLEQLAFLRSLNCDEMQGYFVSRPVPSEEFRQLLEDARRPTAHRLLRAA
jgi:diguanylate cyclase (GGDEF)-like protein